MPDFPVVNTWILDIPLMQTTTDAAGTVTSIPMPTSVALAAASSSASMGAVIAPSPDGTTQWLSVNAMVALSDSTNGGGNITVDITDAAGAEVHDTVGPFSIVGAPAVVSIAHADLATATHTRSQSIPAAPGP